MDRDKLEKQRIGMCCLPNYTQAKCEHTKSIASDRRDGTSLSFCGGYPGNQFVDHCVFRVKATIILDPETGEVV